jgi:hypothetical protein
MAGKRKELKTIEISTRNNEYRVRLLNILERRRFLLSVKYNNFSFASAQSSPNVGCSCSKVLPIYDAQVHLTGGRRKNSLEILLYLHPLVGNVLIN